MAARKVAAWTRERLCRYIARPAIAEKRLSLTPTGKVRYELKTPFRNGTTHVIIEPLDFIARLAALVPKPRVNLTRFHEVFAPNSKHRALITPAGRGKGGKQVGADIDDRSFAERHAAMTWAQRLKRVFNIDIETCEKCRGRSGSSPASKSRRRSGRYWIISSQRRRPISSRDPRRAGRRPSLRCLSDD